MEGKSETKSRLLLILSKQQGEFLSNDSQFKIISNYDELNKILLKVNENHNENILEFIYSYKSIIHNNILYKEEKTINIGNFKLKNIIAEYYYLYLLIIEEAEIINYEYSFEFLKKVYSFLKNINSKSNYKLLKIVISKIVLEIINNFCETDNYNEDINGEEIQIFKNEINSIVKNNLDVFKELNLNINEENITSFKANDIICEFLISLIKQNKLDNYEYIYSFLEQMDLLNIRIGKDILERLKIVLDKKNDYMKPYIIDSKDHLSDESRINFYYILFKFILKDPIYIYQIDFLIETRNRILNIIKSNKFTYDNTLNNANLEKLKYVLETFAGSQYFFQNSEEIKDTLSKLKEVLTYYQFYLFESKKKEIEEVKEHIKKQNIQSKYLAEYDEALQANNAYPLIKNIFYISNNKEIKSENDLNSNYKNWIVMHKCIKEGKLKKLKKKDILKKIFTDENNKDMLLKVFQQNEIDNFIKLLKESEKENKKKDVLSVDINDRNETMEEAPPTIQNKIHIFNNVKDNEVKVNGINGISLKNNQNNVEKNYVNNSSSESTKSTSSPSSSEENENDKKNKENKENKNKIEYIFVDNHKYKNEFSTFADKILNKCKIYLSLKKNGDKNYLVINKVIIGQNNLSMNVEKFKDYVKSSMEIKILKDNSYKFANFINEFEERIVDEYNNNFYFDINIEIKNTDKPNSDGSFNIDALYTCLLPVDGKELKYRENNILLYGIESNLQGFNFMIIDLNQEKFKNEIYKENNLNDNIKKSEKEENNILKNSNSSSFSESNDINKKANEETILEIIRIIENKHNYNGLITELNNGFFMYTKNDNTIVLIDNKYSPVTQIKDYGDKIINACELLQVEQKKKVSNEEDEKHNLQFVTLGNRQLYLTTLDMETLEHKIKQLDISHLYCFSCIEMKKNNFFAIGKNLASYYTDLFTNIEPKEFQINLKKSYFNSIKINENVVAITSNSLYPNGDDVLNFLNVKKKKLLQNEIKGPSFIISQNGMEIMPKFDTEKNKILLCACKKYTKNQNNGILLVNPNLGDNKQLDNPFYNTGDIEIHCFCPILTINNDKIIKDTNYFFAGGFDQRKRKGIIRLYKTNYGKKAYNTTIEYIQDIELKKNKNIEGFNGPINCIKQSKTTGNILASCYNGNIYLLTPPDISYYLKEDMK